MFQVEPLSKTSRSVSRIQPKLKIGKPGDRYEQEADAVASQVMMMGERESLQIQPIEEDEEMVQPELRMQPLEGVLQFAPIGNGGFASPEITQQLSSSRGGGQPLPAETNQFMSSAFGTDFSGVEIHTGSDAVQMNRQLGAKAFTYGNDIYFNTSEYNPNSTNGKRLLAHELTHITQQTNSVNRSLIQRERIGGVTVNTVNDFMVQMKRKTHLQLKGLTVSAFDRHRKTEQMDWANDPDFTQDELDVMWGLLEWGTGGLASIRISEVINKYLLCDINTLRYLKNYCDAINGKLDDEPTIQLQPVTILNNAIKQGKWIEILNFIFDDGSHVKSTVPLNVFVKLISDESVAEDFITYYKECKPIIQTTEGLEIDAFITLIGSEKAKISDYKTDLPDIRNYHKFKKGSLDKLKSDKGKKDKPLTLIMLALYDYNGAFIRDEDMSKVIQNTKTNVYVVEGMDKSRLADLGKSGLEKIANDHGKNGKITQVMIAGHGNSKVVEVGGEGTSSYKSEGGEYKTDQVEEFNLEFGGERDAFWTAFFNELFKHMEVKDRINPAILLNACLTASNEIDISQLTKDLRSSHIYLGVSGIDLTSDDKQDKIRAAIKRQFSERGSLASVLENKVKAANRNISIIGAQASTTSYETRSIRSRTGELGLFPVTTIPGYYQDPYVAGTKIQYLRYGKEPVGVLKAVIESWADNKEDCFTKMQERINKNQVNTNEEFIIHLLFKTIISRYNSDILNANKFVASAGILSKLATGGNGCRSKSLRDDEMIQEHRADFYNAILGKFSNKKAHLVIYVDWMQKESAKYSDFINTLANRQFGGDDNTKQYLDFSMIDGHIEPILRDSIGNERGRVLLALIKFISDNDNAPSKKYLCSLNDANGDSLPSLVKRELKGYDENLLRSKLGLSIGNPISSTNTNTSIAPPEPKKNIITANNYYVEAMQATKYVSRSKAEDSFIIIRKEPDSNSDILDAIPPNSVLTVVGAVRKIDNKMEIMFYMVRRENKQIGYVDPIAIIDAKYRFAVAP